MSRFIIEDPKLCGLGEGETCCAFLVASSQFECGREIGGIKERIQERLAAGTINARGNPGEAPFPDCQTARLPDGDA